MQYHFLAQLIALSLYVALVGFCFCDGFKLHSLRKVLWYIVFLPIALYVLRSKGEFDLALILPIPTLLAILLGVYEKMRAKKRIT